MRTKYSTLEKCKTTFVKMNYKSYPAPVVDGLIQKCQAYPTLKHGESIKNLLLVFYMMCKMEKQGDDELRRIWITAERGNIEDFGEYNELAESGDVESYKDYEELWKTEYPDKIKWYNFSVNKYMDVFYFYIDSALIFQFKENEISEQVYDFQFGLSQWLLKKTEGNITRIQQDISEFNEYLNVNLPYKKRFGRLLRSDFWTIFPDYMKDFKNFISPEKLEILEKIQIQSNSMSFRYLPTFNSGDFFRFCEISYDANAYFDKNNNALTAKEKYSNLSDGRDCGLKLLNENSDKEFFNWYDNKMNCGGHPWEICRGGNSTHISLFVCRNEFGWYLRLEGCSETRVLETIKMALALFNREIPFILGKSEEIFRIACGTDFIGIVPDTVVPVYCHGYFPNEDKIIDFMNLGTEKCNEIVNMAYWYPLHEIRLR